MKNTVKNIVLCAFAAVAVSVTSCSKWLDVNTDPDNPTSASATLQNRLPWIEFYTNYAYQVASWRTTMQCGDWTRNSNNGGNYFNASIWNPVVGITTTPYQLFFVGAGANIQDMYDKGMAQEAYHYAGAARIIRGLGFMMLVDLYGEMPYTEALGADATPSYDDGQTIYMGVLKELEEGIELMGKTQGPDAPSLAEGDIWNGGNTDKWIKLGHLLRARAMIHLTKKDAGSYEEGKYDESAILAELAAAQQSNSDNTVQAQQDTGMSYTDPLWSEPTDYSPFYSVCGMNAGYIPTEMLVNNLTNFAGLGVEDPRADKILPWAVSRKSATTPANVVFKGIWRRSIGVDMTTPATPLANSGPIRSDFDPAKGGWYIATESDARRGDTLYVENWAGSKGYAKDPDFYARRKKGDDNSRLSGTFYNRPDVPSLLGTYMEACFIKAEVLFNKGDKPGAFTAYSNGIKASLELMNSQLKVWTAAEATTAGCPSFTPWTDAEINSFMSNGIGTAADLTLGRILTQKRVAMMFSLETWNDMRRYDYDKTLFFGWDIPYRHSQVAAATKAIPAGQTWRRWRQCSHEVNYNAENLKAIGEKVPGAKTESELWQTEPDMWTIPVWWDQK